MWLNEGLTFTGGSFSCTKFCRFTPVLLKVRADSHKLYQVRWVICGGLQKPSLLIRGALEVMFATRNLRLIARLFAVPVAPGFLLAHYSTQPHEMECVSSSWTVKVLSLFTFPLHSRPESNQVPLEHYALLHPPLHHRLARSWLMPSSRSGRRSPRRPFVILSEACPIFCRQCFQAQRPYTLLSKFNQFLWSYFFPIWFSVQFWIQSSMC